MNLKPLRQIATPAARDPGQRAEGQSIKVAEMESLPADNF